MSSRYSCLPDTEALRQLRSAWSWCLPKQFEVVLVTAFGDVFFEVAGEGIYWLNTGTAEAELVAADRADFHVQLSGEKGLEWLLPDLIHELQREGKPLPRKWLHPYSSSWWRKLHTGIVQRRGDSRAS